VRSAHVVDRDSPDLADARDADSHGPYLWESADADRYGDTYCRRTATYGDPDRYGNGHRDRNAYGDGDHATGSVSVGR
jgi:hypothetical protein